MLSTTFNDTKEFTNDSVRLETLLLLLLLLVNLFIIMYNRIVSDIITMQASNDLNGNLTIQFIVRKELKKDNSVSIQSLLQGTLIFNLYLCYLGECWTILLCISGE